MATSKANDINDFTSFNIIQTICRLKMRLDISKATKIEQKRDQDSFRESVDRGREFLIDAAIVRVMKMRKTIGHQALLTEVVEQLAAQFKPKIVMIKVRIVARLWNLMQEL